MKETASFKGCYEAPKWACFKKWFDESCFYYDLDGTITISRGILRESGYFKVTGKEKDVSAFANEFEKAAEAYNA